MFGNPSGRVKSTAWSPRDPSPTKYDRGGDSSMLSRANSPQQTRMSMDGATEWDMGLLSRTRCGVPACGAGRRSVFARRGRHLVEGARRSSPCAPGNPGFAQVGTSVSIALTGIDNPAGRKFLRAPVLVEPHPRRSESAARRHSSIWAPISTTRLGGIPKKAVAGWALRERNANRRSRHSAIPGRFVGSTVSRPRKNVT